MPISSSRSRARLGAPPCSGPDSAPMAPTMQAPTSAPVEAMTRAVNVDALKPWSMVAIRYCSRARARSGSGSSPVSIQRRLAAVPRSGRGSIGSRPCRSWYSAASERRRHRGQRQRVEPALGRGRCRAPAASRARRRRATARCAARRAGPAARGGDGGQHAADRGRARSAAARPRRRRPGARSASGRCPSTNRCQTSSNEHVPGQVDRRVLAVVVEALAAPDVADRGVGDHHPLETGRDLDEGGIVRHGSIVRP